MNNICSGAGIAVLSCTLAVLAAGSAATEMPFPEVGKEADLRRIGAGILDQDWHCVYEGSRQVYVRDVKWRWE